MQSNRPVFDVLYVGSILQRRFGDVARGEIHLFTDLGLAAVRD